MVAELDALTVEHPYREHLRAMHMLALYRSGRQAEALRAFGRTREMLVEGLGIDPSPELRELERRILAQDRDLLISVGPKVLRRAVARRRYRRLRLERPGWNGSSRSLDARLSWRRPPSGIPAMKLAPKGTAGYAVFVEPIHAVRAARAIVNDRTRVAVDVGDLELGDHDPVGPPLSRAARLVAVAHPGQVLLSAAAHDALGEQR